MRAPRWLTRTPTRIFPAGSGPGWLLLLTGFVLVGLWQGQLRRAARAEQTARLDAKAKQIAGQLQGRLGEYELTLQGLRGLFEGSNKVDPDEFERYCKTTDPLRHLPGLLAVNTLHRVAAADAAGVPLWSEENGAGHPPPLRPFYFPVTYRYPPAPGMIGFDAGSTPVFAAAIEAAEQNDGLAVSAPVVFTNAAQERRAGFIMVLPYYTGGVSHRPPAEGFVELVVGSPRLLDDILTPADLEALHLVLRDEGGSLQEEPLLELGPPAARAGGWRRAIPFGGRVWSLAITGESMPAGIAAQPGIYFALLAVLLLASLVAGMGIAGNRARAAAASLRASEERARGLMDANLIGIFFAGAGGRLLEANDAFLDLLDFSREDLAAGRIDLQALTPPELQERTRLGVAELLQTGVAQPFEKEYFRRDGSRVSVLVGAARLAAGHEEFATFVLDLTARKKTEEALRDNLLLLDRAQELAHLGIWQWKVAAGQMHWSPELYRIYGLEAATFTPSLEGYFARLHDEDRERIRTQIAAALKERRSFSFEERILRPGGEPRILRSWGGLRLDAGGAVTHLYGTCLDITDQRAAESGLRANEERLRVATDAAQIGTWDWNFATGEVRWSEIVDAIFGFAPGEFPGTYEAYFTRIHPEDRAMVTAATQNAQAGGKRYPLEYRLLRPDGEIRWLAGQDELLRDENGHPLRMIGTLIDITRRKQTELRLAESEAKYRDIFNFTPVGIYRSAPDGRILAANQALAALLGYADAQSLIGRDMASEIYQDALERDRLIANYEPGGAATRLEVEFRRRNQAPVWVQLDAHAVKDAQGRTLYFEGFVHDIDARKRTENAQEASRAAHEKRTALLLAIARSPALAGDLPAILDAVTEAAVAGLHCARSSIWFFSASGTAECAGRYLAADSRHAPGGTLRADDYPEYFSALAKGALLVISDLVRDPRTANFAATYLAPLGITASLVAPLRVGGELAGMLTCDHTGGPRAWTLEEQGFLIALGDLMVLARETGERRRAEAQLRALNEALEERVALRTAALARSNAELAIEADERRRTVDELRASTALLTAVTEGTTDAIYVKDREGRYLFINSAGAHFMGLPPGRILGRSNAEIYSPESTATQTARDRNLLDLGRTQTFDEIIEREGERHIMLATKGVMRNIAGEITGLFGISRDITSRREQEADLERLNHSLQARRMELEALNEELETFSYSVSHDLRAPLRAIDGFSQALVEDFGEPLGVDGKNLLDRVRAGAKQMGQLIDGLLQLSRASRGALHREPLDLSALARSVVNDLQAGDPVRRPKVFIENDLHAEGDPALLRAVLQNLLGNAWKFTAGVADAEIHFSRTDTRRRPGFVVRDTGVGFDPAYAGKLFQPFQRLHRASDFPGTGIGLATVQRIIRRHSGRVWADSKPSRGASFYFTLWDATSDLLEEKIEE